MTALSGGEELYTNHANFLRPFFNRSKYELVEIFGVYNISQEALARGIDIFCLYSTDEMRPYANRIVGWVMICDDCRKMSQQYFSDQS